MPSPAHQATGRQRRDNSRPSGNSSTRKVEGIRIQGIQERFEYQAPIPARLSIPFPVSTQYVAYAPNNQPIPTVTAAPAKIQPIAFLGCRDPIRPPSTEKTTMNDHGNRERPSRPSPAESARSSALIMSKSENAASPHASRPHRNSSPKSSAVVDVVMVWLLPARVRLLPRWPPGVS